MASTQSSYHHGDLRKALTEEAAKIVEREGVDALTLRELARRLGVSHAAPAHHFADKASLLCELAADGFDELADELEAGARRGRTPVTQLREAGRGYVRFAMRRPGHYRVMFGREISEVTRSPRLVSASTRAYAVLERAVTRALSAPSARSPDRVREAAFFAWSSTHGAAMLLLDGPRVFQGEADKAQALIDDLTAKVAESISESPPRKLRVRDKRSGSRARGPVS